MTPLSTELWYDRAELIIPCNIEIDFFVVFHCFSIKPEIKNWIDYIFSSYEKKYEVHLLSVFTSCETVSTQNTCKYSTYRTNVVVGSNIDYVAAKKLV